MRLKLFTAESVPAAMKAVRDALGADAVIVDVDQGRRGAPVRVLAAVEAPPEPSRAPVQDMARLLRDHGTPEELIARLQAAGDGDLHRALALLLATRPLPPAPATRLLLVGLPGQGKTLAAARLAAQAVLAGLKPRVVTLDGSAGALAQLRTLCEPLALSVETATPQDGDGPLIIDTGGINPYALADVEQLARTAGRSRAEIIWVHAAGGDANEALDHAAIFASLGARSLLATRLDACRRLGSLLELLMSGPVPLAGFSASPFLGDPIIAPDPAALADRVIDTARTAPPKR